MFYWETTSSPQLPFRPFVPLVNRETQTENFNIRKYITDHPREVLKILGLNPDSLLNKMKKSNSTPGQRQLSVQNCNCNLDFIDDVALDISDDQEEENCPFLWDNRGEADNFQLFESIRVNPRSFKFRKNSP